MNVWLPPAGVTSTVPEISTASRSAFQDLLPIFRLYLVVALSATFRWTASSCRRGRRIILRSEPYSVEGRRVRLSTQTRKVWWLRSPAPGQTLSFMVNATGQSVATSTFNQGQGRGVAFGFRCLLVACTIFWWLRSPVSISKLVEGVSTSGTGATDSGYRGCYATSSRGVAFGFRLCSAVRVKRLRLRSPWPQNTRFRMVDSTGAVSTNDSGGASVTNARSVAFGFRC